jgi:hypothetical protein
MIEEIIGKHTPYIVNAKKLYDEADVKAMMVELLKKLNPPFVDKSPEREYHPGATC